MEKELLFTTERNFEIEDINDLESELNELLSSFKYTIKGIKSGYLLISKRFSHYGSICNNGAIGYKIIGNDLVSEILKISDTFEIYKIENKIEIIFYDHDGINSVQIFPLNKTSLNYIQSHNHNQIINYSKKLNRL